MGKKTLINLLTHTKKNKTKKHKKKKKKQNNYPKRKKKKKNTVDMHDASDAFLVTKDDRHSPQQTTPKINCTLQSVNVHALT